MSRQCESSTEEAGWESARARLEGERLRIQQEITAYPTPIAGCDQQFSHLLEQRARLFQELARLRDAEAEGRKSGDPGLALREFVRSSHFLDEPTRREIR